MRKRHTTRYPGVMFRLVDEAKPDGARRYIVAFTDAEGTERTKTLPLGSTLEDAVLLRGQLLNRRANGETLVRPKMTVAELLDRHLESLEGRLDATTLEAHRYGAEVVKRQVGRRLVAELTPSDVASLIRRLEGEGRAASTIKRYLAPLSGAYKVAVRDGLVQSSPVQKLLPHEQPRGKAKEMRCLGRVEIEGLLSSAPSHRWKTLFATLVFTGLRISEALALTWDDITDGGVVVRESKTDAGRRTVILIPAVRRLLSELRLSQTPGTKFVFATQEGAPLGRRNALTALSSTCKRAGVPKCSLHELRHTFASILIDQRELPTLVAKQMGHADPSVTMKTYAHLFEAQESTDAALERLQATMGGMV